MFSATTCQPQVAVAVNQLSTVLHSVRNGSYSVVIPRSRRGQRTRSKQSNPEVTQWSSDGMESKEVDPKVKQLDMESCLAFLMNEDNIQKLSTYFGVQDKNHWKSNYVSAPTFFENKNGFTEYMLNIPTQAAGFCSILKPDVVRLLSHNLVLAQTIDQRRMYRRETRKTGLGTASFELDKEPKMSNEFVDKLYEGQPKEVKDKINMAYMAGLYNNAEKSSSLKNKSTKEKSTIALRYFFYALIAYFLYRQMSDMSVGPGNGGFPLVTPGRFEVNPEEVKVKFSDVKGCDEAKEELADIVEFLKNGEKFNAIGAKLPKGVLLVGTPGVGKTLLAKAVAGEAGVHYFHASGSEFDEMFVGSGSRKVRQLFAAAKMRAPSVIFIDEIDSVGSKRTSSQIHPYANQTVNQLLSEMDGFTGSQGVIVIGATNKRDNLDHALLRPGRFDMEVNVLPPDAKGREEIFRLYLSKVHASKDLDYEKLGLMTRGMTGADINNIVNQAALRAVLEGHNVVTMKDIDYARDKVIMGPAWKNKKIDEQTNWNTAYHEAGHTIVAYFSKEAMPIHKVTILPRGRSLGHTSFTEEKEMYGSTKAQMLARIDVAMGGRIGEEIVHGSEQVTDGASSDFQGATQIATAMVKKYGMSEKVGPRVHSDALMDGGNSFVQVNDISPGMQEVIDTEIDKILSESYKRAKDLLTTHKKEHQLLAEALMKYETLDSKEIKDVLEGRPLNRLSTEKTVKGVCLPFHNSRKDDPKGVPDIRGGDKNKL